MARASNHVVSWRSNMRFILCTASMRHCTEGDVDFALKLSFYPVTSSCEARKDLGKSLSGCASPGDSEKFYLGMLAKQAGQFGADVAGDAYDTCSYLWHSMSSALCYIPCD